MSQARTIQFKKIPLILEYYEDEDFTSWQIKHGKEVHFSYSDEDKIAGSEKLKKVLGNLYSEGSSAIYTLRIYDDENEMCCNFRLHDHSELYVPGVVGGMPAQNEILSLLRAQEKQLEAMNERLKELEDDDEDDDEGEGEGLGSIGGLLANPFVQGFLGKLFDSGLKDQPTKPAAISGAFDSETQEQKISRAIAILKQHDEKLGDHLLKLASIAQSNPTKFKSLISTLILL